jgi:hypothetical protein
MCTGDCNLGLPCQICGSNGQVIGEIEEVVECKNCEFATVAEDTWSGVPVAYFCDKNNYEYKVCDVGMVSPEYSCINGKEKEL